ncbi:MAG: hypothetical protein CME63_01935 [Halobacteriovoraceae bacterium]|nr:hypothetical protein [Halobacteriovoraceae bacterium]MBC96483.1 hypothetical protein [Halobacteriovoraceae bacterium]
MNFLEEFFILLNDFTDKRSMKLRNLNKSYLTASFYTLIFSTTVYCGLQFLSLNSYLKRVFILLGGDIANGGIIQSFIFFSFMWAYLEIRKDRKEIKNEFKYLCLELLPTRDKHVLLPLDIPHIESKLAKLAKSQSRDKGSILVRLLSTALLKFKSTQSMSETIDVISIQSEISRELHESEHSNIRYLLWLIPSIGFIGTVIGISQALSIAAQGDMEAITSMLGVAFDTTLVSLVLSAIVTGLFHRLQEETDKLHAHIKEYVISNFVNRLEIKKDDLKSAG